MGFGRASNAAKAQAVQETLETGCSDAAAVRHPLSFGERAHAPVEHLDLDMLKRQEPPLPGMSNYGLLFEEVTEVSR